MTEEKPLETLPVVAAPDKPKIEIEWRTSVRSRGTKARPGGNPRWNGYVGGVHRYTIEEDSDTPLGKFYSLNRMTAAPAGARDMGGASHLRIAMDSALEDANR